MKNKYYINDLITGNVTSISSKDLSCNESIETFIFEGQTKKPFCSRIYKEIFTELGMKLDSDNPEDKYNSINLNKNYIINEQDITYSGLLTDKEQITGFITKMRLLEIYNALNFQRRVIPIRANSEKQNMKKRKRG